MTISSLSIGPSCWGMRTRRCILLPRSSLVSTLHTKISTCREGRINMTHCAVPYILPSTNRRVEPFPCRRIALHKITINKSNNDNCDDNNNNSTEHITSEAVARLVKLPVLHGTQKHIAVSLPRKAYIILPAQS